MLAIRRSFAVLVVVVGVPAGSATTTAFSPGSSEPATTDVGRIMFQRAPGGEVVEAEETDVYVVNADGSEEQLLAAGAGPGRWSPDGSEVSIFCCDDGGAAHLLNPDTGEVRRLEQADPTLDSYCGAAWSPDGERLSCEAYGVDDPSLNGIYSVRASDGGDLTRITSNPGGQDTPGEYSPDGTRLVFVRFEDDVPVGYFVTNVDGTGVRQLTPDGMVLDDSGFGGSWSPSGDDILFVARETERASQGDLDRQRRRRFAGAAGDHPGVRRSAGRGRRVRLLLAGLVAGRRQDRLHAVGAGRLERDPLDRQRRRKPPRAGHRRHRRQSVLGTTGDNVRPDRRRTGWRNGGASPDAKWVFRTAIRPRRLCRSPSASIPSSGLHWR